MLYTIFTVLTVACVGMGLVNMIGGDATNALLYYVLSIVCKLVAIDDRLGRIGRSD